jgi:hypothetical protein
MTLDIGGDVVYVKAAHGTMLTVTRLRWWHRVSMRVRRALYDAWHWLRLAAGEVRDRLRGPDSEDEG